jgi:hypothetical protein
LKLHGTAGYFVVFKKYFSFANHMNPNFEHHNVCIPGLSIENDNEGLVEIEQDTQIPIVYALSSNGDKIMMFSIDAKSKAHQILTKRSSIKMIDEQPKLAFTSFSQCQLAGNIKFSKITEGGDKIINMKSMKGQLLLQMQSGKMFMMEATSTEQILLNPYITEVKTSISHMIVPSSNTSKRFPFKMIRKSSGE